MSSWLHCTTRGNYKCISFHNPTSGWFEIDANESGFRVLYSGHTNVYYSATLDLSKFLLCCTVLSDYNGTDVWLKTVHVPAVAYGFEQMIFQRVPLILYNYVLMVITFSRCVYHNQPLELNSSDQLYSCSDYTYKCEVMCFRCISLE